MSKKYYSNSHWDNNREMDNIERDFLAIYRYWYMKLYSFVFIKIKSSTLAEDIVQQTFLKVWERRDFFNKDVKFSSQLFQIARTTMVDELRKQALTRKYIDYEKPFLAKKYIDLERQIIFRDQLEYIKKVIQEMPVMRQRVFMMHKIEELSHKEIAVQLSISPKTVENHITLAFKYLRKNNHTG